ncbi:glycosyltransferase family 2 protein [Aeromonas veronii]|uniref:glycosyltransferase family 2 protein n=1 Tax=Aeromonas veronii TaxID=654 RepID=UPI003F742043
MIKLSIIVPVYNVAEYIGECFDSIYNQSLKKHFEVIFVNDGSTDNSHDILMSRCHGVDNFYIYSKSNGGLSSARNYGLSRANGEFISFLDSDDWIDVNYVENILSSIEEYKADLYYFDRAFVRGNKIIHTQMPYFKGLLKDNPSILFQLNISACNKVYHKRLFHNNIFPLGVIYEDFPFMFKTYTLVDRICKVPGCLYYVRQTNPNSITSGIHRQEIDMLTNLESVKALKISSEREFVRDYFNYFEINTILSWSMKLLRGREIEILKKIDYHKYDKGLIKGVKNKFLYFLLLNKWYDFIYCLFFLQRVKKYF